MRGGDEHGSARRAARRRRRQRRLGCDVGAYESASTPLAVTLASFDAQAMVDHIQLSWETVSEANNAGFNLYRSASPAAPDALLAYVPSQAPGSTQGASYSFDDTQVSTGPDVVLLAGGRGPERRDLAARPGERHAASADRGDAGCAGGAGGQPWAA